MVDYICRNIFIKLSVKSPEVFWAIFQLLKKGKENVKRIVDLFEALNEQKQIKKKEKITSSFDCAKANLIFDSLRLITKDNGHCFF